MSLRITFFQKILCLMMSVSGFSAMGAGGSDAVAPFPESVLRTLQAERLPLHPLAQAAMHRVEQARQGVDAAAGYFDTLLSASGGSATWNRPVPGSTLNAGIGANSIAIQTGVEQAVTPGLFLSAGVAERYLLESGGRDRDLYQSLAGIQARVPLLRNRGHAQWRWEHQGAEANLKAAQQQLRTTLQQLRLESDSAYIELLQATADAEAFRRAGQRVKALLAETETLVSLKAVPEYQLYPSRMDTALREEEIAAAEYRIKTVRLRLQTLFGDLSELTITAEDLPRWADLLYQSTPPIFAGDVIQRRGAIENLKAQIESARAAEALSRDATRPDLWFALSGTWQAESTESVIGREALIDDEKPGVEAALVFSVPLQRRRERAAWQADAARAAEIEALLDQQYRVVASQLEDAQIALMTARERVRLVSSAVENARLTLDAEAERFRLGEGRSRNVLDAQKDLTAAELRRNAAAGTLLQANASLAFAAAYPDGLLPAAQDTTDESILQNYLGDIEP